MDSVRIAIVSSGEMGRVYSEGITRYNKGVALVAIWGGTRAEGLAAEYKADYEPTLESLLDRKDVDAVLIASPHDAHVRQVMAAAEAGKHVLVEKPMALSVSDCDAMIDACRKAKVALSVVKTARYTYSRIREAIDEGKIGKVLMVQNSTLYVVAHVPKEWWYTPESGGGLLDAGSHIFDFFRWLTDDDPVSIYGSVRSVSGPGWHGLSAMAQARFSGGATAQTWLSFEVQAPGFDNTRFQWRIWGEHGLIDCDGYGKLKVSSHGRPWEEVWKRPTYDRYGDPLNPERVRPFQKNTQDFVDALREGRAPSVTGEDGRAAVEMVQATYLSSLTGSSVRLPLPRTPEGFQFDGATVPRHLIPG